MIKQILFVEDDDTIAFGVKNALQMNDYLVQHYPSAEKALLGTPDWDLAILDWMLPGMSGLELLQKFKQKY